MPCFRDCPVPVTITEPFPGETLAALTLCTGTGRPCATCNIFLNGSPATCAVCDASGNWACACNFFLPPGSHQLCCAMRGAGGQCSTAVCPFTISS